VCKYVSNNSRDASNSRNTNISRDAKNGTEASSREAGSREAGNSRDVSTVEKPVIAGTTSLTLAGTSLALAGMPAKSGA
jgi:hypothetical protein